MAAASGRHREGRAPACNLKHIPVHPLLQRHIALLIHWHEFRRIQITAQLDGFEAAVDRGRIGAVVHAGGGCGFGDVGDAVAGAPRPSGRSYTVACQTSPKVRCELPAPPGAPSIITGLAYSTLFDARHGPGGADRPYPGGERVVNTGARWTRLPRPGWRVAASQDDPRLQRTRLSQGSRSTERRRSLNPRPVGIQVPPHDRRSRLLGTPPCARVGPARFKIMQWSAWKAYV